MRNRRIYGKQARGEGLYSTVKHKETPSEHEAGSVCLMRMFCGNCFRQLYAAFRSEETILGLDFYERWDIIYNIVR